MRRRIAIGLLASLVLATGAATRATVPGQVDFQGLLLDSGGQPATGTVDAAGNLGLGDTYLAWLSDATTDPASRFTQTGRFFSHSSGDEVADDWADLTDGPLDPPIHPPGGVVVGSNTATDGSYDDTAQDCLGWTTSDPSELGERAAPSSTSGAWTSPGFPIACDTSFPVYCFEQ